MNNTVRLKKCIITAILASISVVLYVIGPKFTLPSIFSSFLVINFSMVPIFIGLLTMGYKEGLVIVIIRFLFKLMLGTTTAGVGETADLIIGLCLVLFTVLGKKLFNSKAHYIPMFSFAILGWIVGGLLSNIFALPMYINVVGYSSEAFASMLAKIYPQCNVDNYIFYYFILAILPFNLLLSVLVIGVTYGVWMPLHSFTDEFFNNKSKEEKTKKISYDDLSHTYEDINKQ